MGEEVDASYLKQKDQDNHGNPSVAGEIHSQGGRNNQSEKEEK